MKKPIKVSEYAQRILEALPRGALLNTQADKFDAMVIGWGALGQVWGMPAMTVYVRRGRFTREQLDEAGEFTVSVPLGDPIPEINRICGTLSGRVVDKVDAANLELEPPEVIATPGVRQYPLTLECKVLYAQEQDLSRLPKDIRERMYPQDVDGDYPMSNRDPHTAYIGRIVSAYIIE